MITHYDMVTGEVIDDNTNAPERQAADFPARADLRLTSVHEACLIEQRIAAAAPAILMLPVGQLLGD